MGVLVIRGSVAATAKLLQSCPTLCDPTDGSPPGSSVRGILQARILERVAISFSSVCMHAKSIQSIQSCTELTLCNPMDSSPAGPSVHRILQARRLEWVAISFSEFVGLQKQKMTSFSIEMNYLKRTEIPSLLFIWTENNTFFPGSTLLYSFILQIIYF